MVLGIGAAVQTMIGTCRRSLRAHSCAFWEVDGALEVVRSGYVPLAVPLSMLCPSNNGIGIEGVGDRPLRLLHSFTGQTPAMIPSVAYSITTAGAAPPPVWPAGAPGSSGWCRHPAQSTTAACGTGRGAGHGEDTIA
jgi:hypothetical protein